MDDERANLQPSNSENLTLMLRYCKVVVAARKGTDGGGFPDGGGYVRRGTDGATSPMGGPGNLGDSK